MHVSISDGPAGPNRLQFVEVNPGDPDQILGYITKKSNKKMHEKYFANPQSILKRKEFAT